MYKTAENLLIFTYGQLKTASLLMQQLKIFVKQRKCQQKT